MVRHRRLHIAVLDPAVQTPELDNFNHLMELAPDCAFSYHLPALFGIESLHSVPSAIDAVIIFGSGASVYDGLAWQVPLNDWLLQRMEQKTPILGICYGHQLLAYLLQGRVDYANPTQEKWKGLRSFAFTQSGPWGKAGDSATMIVSHREVVVALPEHCTVIAQSSTVDIEAFVHQSLPLWGIQAHPEAARNFIARLDLPDLQPASAISSGSRFLQTFFQEVRKKSSQKSTS